MIAPKDHKQEAERLKDLESYSILDTLPETDYDNLTAIAAEICGTPISLVSLIDSKRQWFKSHHGMVPSETPKEYAFCAHALHDAYNIFTVQDARRDERFHDNPLVTGDPYVIFYAGVPLVSEAGLPLGTLCVIDHKPKLLSQSQLRSLTALSKQIMNLIELRKKTILLEKALLDLEEKNNELEQFAFIAAHDLKSPLANISSLVQLFSSDYSSKIDTGGHTMLELIKNSSDRLRGLINGLLEYSKSENLLKEKKIKIDIESLKKDVHGLFAHDNKLSINLRSTLREVYASRTVLEQILINLIANSIKYSDKKNIEIEIGVSEHKTEYEFYVLDNGPGIAPAYHERIFRIFEVLAEKDKFGEPGNGIGLATVKKIVEKSGRSIKVESVLGKGAKFIFTLEK